MLPLILNPSWRFVIWKADTGGWWEIYKNVKHQPQLIQWLKTSEASLISVLDIDFIKKILSHLLRLTNKFIKLCCLELKLNSFKTPKILKFLWSDIWKYMYQCQKQEFYFLFECKIINISYFKLQNWKRVIPLLNMAILQLAIPENILKIFGLIKITMFIRFVYLPVQQCKMFYCQF